MKVSTIFNIRNVELKRTVETSLIYAMTEMGELSDEILKGIGHSIKPETEDGVIGECVDVIVCLLDIIQLSYPEVSATQLAMEINKTIDKKVDKWSNKKYS